MVPTDTHSRGGYMSDRFVALTWSGAVEGRLDWPSDRCQRQLGGDEASKLLRALRVTAVKFGLELASQPAARRDAKEVSDARAALRKRWTGAVSIN